MKKIKKNNSLN